MGFVTMANLKRFYRAARRSQAAIGILAIVLVIVATSAASACPTCKDGLAQNDPHGQSVAAGYYYSILFMMSMPYIILTTLGGIAYRAVKKAEAQRASTANSPESENRRLPVVESQVNCSQAALR
jgi:heme/copper-type cytochrome/quinol oxidase subunit 2